MSSETEKEASKRIEAMLDALMRASIERDQALKKIEEQNRALAEYRAMMEVQLNMARTIQQALFPKNYEGRSIRLAGKTRELEEIGGDFYDFWIYDGGARCVFIVIDVIGHGVPAALTTVQIKIYVEHMLKDFGFDLPRIANALNDTFYHAFYQLGYFFTGIIGMVDLHAMKCTLVNAGHCDGYLIRGNGIRTVGEGDNFVFGCVKTPGYHETSFPIAVGDRVLFLTDGMLETATADGTPFEDHIKARLHARRNEPLSTVVEDCVAEVASYTVKDDLTLFGFELVPGV